MVAPFKVLLLLGFRQWERNIWIPVCILSFAIGLETMKRVFNKMFSVFKVNLPFSLKFQNLISPSLAPVKVNVSGRIACENSISMGSYVSIDYIPITTKFPQRKKTLPPTWNLFVFCFGTFREPASVSHFAFIKRLCTNPECMTAILSHSFCLLVSFVKYVIGGIKNESSCFWSAIEDYNYRKI